jgi:hypothetical protein
VVGTRWKVRKSSAATAANCPMKIASYSPSRRVKAAALAIEATMASEDTKVVENNITEDQREREGFNCKQSSFLLTEVRPQNSLLLYSLKIVCENH